MPPGPVSCIGGTKAPTLHCIVLYCIDRCRDPPVDDIVPQHHSDPLSATSAESCRMDSVQAAHMLQWNHTDVPGR